MGALALAGCGGSEVASTERSATAPAGSTSSNVARARRAHTHPVSYTHCDQNISVGPHTSCPFADAVFRAYAAALHADTSGTLDHRVEATSSATGKTYTMNCRGHSANSGTESVAICTGGAGATIKFPTIAAQEYTNSTTTSPPVSEESSAPTPTGGEQDEVGSSSHATDSRFCSEHESIGSCET